MNAAVSISDDINFTQEIDSGSDTDTIISDESPPEYYEPISNTPIDDQDQDCSDHNSDDNHHESPGSYQSLSNGDVRCVDNGINELDLNNEDVEDDDDEEEERMREEAMERAFREDERRRRAPLTEENRMRVMEAMRRISLPGFAQPSASTAASSSSS